MLGAGHLEEIPPSVAGNKPQVQFTVHSMPFTWNDANGNQDFDAASEKRKVYELAAVVTRKVADSRPPKKGKKSESAEMRMIVVADSDMISDRVFRNPGNGYLFVDGLKWLGGEEAYIGETSSEEDVRILHTRKEDQVWFYLTIFGIPALVLFSGLYYTLRRRKPPGRAAARAPREEVTDEAPCDVPRHRARPGADRGLLRLDPGARAVRGRDLDPQHPRRPGPGGLQLTRPRGGGEQEERRPGQLLRGQGGDLDKEAARAAQAQASGQGAGRRAGGRQEGRQEARGQGRQEARGQGRQEARGQGRPKPDAGAPAPPSHPPPPRGCARSRPSRATRGSTS